MEMWAPLHMTKGCKDLFRRVYEELLFQKLDPRVLGDGEIMELSRSFYGEWYTFIRKAYLKRCFIERELHNHVEKLIQRAIELNERDIKKLRRKLSKMQPGVKRDESEQAIMKLEDKANDLKSNGITKGVVQVQKFVERCYQIDV